jgi:hypothetical protein
VHRDIGLSIEDRPLDLDRKDALTANRGEVNVRFSIPAGLYE